MRRHIIAILLLAAIPFFSSGQDAVPQIRQSVIRFMDSLTPLQQKRALLAFNDTARMKWNNLPVGLRARVGVHIGSLSDPQRILLHRILSASLSSQGYLKATGIMHLDNLLNMYYDTLYAMKMLPDSMYQFVRDLKWSHQNYYIAIFGDPHRDPNWGFKLEGHHLSVNFTFVDGKWVVTPFFIGTDPSEFPMTEYAGWRVLGLEEDFGIQLLNSLSPAQQQKAIKSSEVPGDIITAAESGKRLVENWGIRGSELSLRQQDILKKIIREFVFNLEYDKALIEYDKIMQAGIGNVYFGWIGEKDEKKPHYYILNGPTFLIEFDNNGGPRRAANHIHAIWREKGNEYGEDILKQHYQSEKH